MTILPRDFPSAVMSKKHFGFDMTVAKLLKRTPKDEKSFCLECNNTEDLPYIQNGGQWGDYRHYCARVQNTWCPCVP